MELKKMVRGSCLLDEPMSKHNTYGIGGPAGAYITPADRKDLAATLSFSYDRNISTSFVGSGSNLLVADDGIDGIVISLEKSFTQLEFNGTNVTAESGVMLGRLVKETVNYGLTGLESLVGIPGTVGGALVMNAGAHGEEISTNLSNIEMMTMDGVIKQVQAADITFNYRHSTFNPGEIILKAEFDFKKNTPEKIHAKFINASKQRKNTQPLKFRSAGSVFKNPNEDRPAGFLIDQAGLKGEVRGDAEISTKHANFFVNHGNATAKDIVELIRLARKAVFEKFGIVLELEIKTLGFVPGTFQV